MNAQQKLSALVQQNDSDVLRAEVVKFGIDDISIVFRAALQFRKEHAVDILLPIAAQNSNLAAWMLGDHRISWVEMNFYQTMEFKNFKAFHFLMDYVDPTRHHQFALHAACCLRNMDAIDHLYPLSDIEDLRQRLKNEEREDLIVQYIDPKTQREILNKELAVQGVERSLRKI